VYKLRKQEIHFRNPAADRKLFLLMSVFSETLLALVRCHFVLLSFLSAWHSNVILFLLPVLPGLQLKFKEGLVKQLF
jgi:hypothetical protein